MAENYEGDGIGVFSHHLHSLVFAKCRRGAQANLLFASTLMQFFQSPRPVRQELLWKSPKVDRKDAAFGHGARHVYGVAVHD